MEAFSASAKGNGLPEILRSPFFLVFVGAYVASLGKLAISAKQDAGDFAYAGSGPPTVVFGGSGCTGGADGIPGASIGWNRR